MAVEVFLAPNLLSLYGFQTLYCIHIAKAPAPGTEIPSNSQHIRAAQLMASPSAQPPGCSDRVTGITGLDKPICPTAPDVCSRNGYHRPRQAYLSNRPGRTSLLMGTHKLSITSHFSKKADAKQNCLSAVLSGVCLCLFFIQEFPYSV